MYGLLRGEECHQHHLPRKPLFVPTSRVLSRQDSACASRLGTHRNYLLACCGAPKKEGREKEKGRKGGGRQRETETHREKQRERNRKRETERETEIETD